MPLPLPNLDDRNYTELVEMARSLIPSEYPEWTDHNPADTGIMLIELLAWLTELLLYRLDKIPDRSQVAFLRLLNGLPESKQTEESIEKNELSLSAATQRTVLDLRRRYRAATANDYERLILDDNQWPQTYSAIKLNQPVFRVKAFPNRDLSTPDKAEETVPGNISVVILPKMVIELEQVSVTPDFPTPTDELRHNIWMYLEPKRLLTTHHHVVGPSYLSVWITATLYLKEGSSKGKVGKKAKQALWKFFHPLVGGDEGTGWPFGRSIYLSEIYQQLDHVEGVDYLQEVQLHLNEESESCDPSIVLKPYELVSLNLERTVLTLTAAWEARNV